MKASLIFSDGFGAIEVDVVSVAPEPSPIVTVRFADGRTKRVRHGRLALRTRTTIFDTDEVRIALALERRAELERRDTEEDEWAMLARVVETWTLPDSEVAYHAGPWLTTWLPTRTTVKARTARHRQWRRTYMLTNENDDLHDWYGVVFQEEDADDVGGGVITTCDGGCVSPK
jgi:hypothetical protein